MTDYDRGPVVHYIEYRGKYEDGYDYSVKHDEDRCPKGEWNWGYDYMCNVQHELYNAGDDAFGVFDNELEHTTPGMYVLIHWVERHPATPSHGEEWSSGLTLGDRVA